MYLCIPQHHLLQFNSATSPNPKVFNSRGSSLRNLIIRVVSTTENQISSYIPAAPIFLLEGPWKQCLNLPSTLRAKAHKHSLFPRFCRTSHKAKAKPQEPEVSVAIDAYTEFKHMLLPITDRNPYLSEGTRQILMNSSDPLREADVENTGATLLEIMSQFQTPTQSTNVINMPIFDL